MAVDLTLKSLAITNREATPRTANSAGAGGGGILREVSSHIASVTASLSVTSVIRLVSVPSNAVVKSIRVSSEAQTAGAFSIGVYRTNADGGLVAAANADQFFTAALSCASAVIDQECVMKATSLNTIAKRNQPLWQAIGMTADPGKDLDICATVTTTPVTTGTGALGCTVQYVV